MVMDEGMQDVAPEQEQEAPDTDSEKATEDTNVEEEAQSTYKELLNKKGFKSEEDLAKAYAELESHKGKLTNENKEYRDWITDVAPLIQAINSNPEIKNYLEEKLQMTEQETAPGVPTPEEGKEKQEQPQSKESQGEATPKQKLEKMYSENPEAVKKMVAEMVGSQVQPLQQKQTQKEIRDTLKEMKSDKERYPHYNKDTERVMAEIIKSKVGKGIPLDSDGIQAVYDMAVARQMDKILKEKEKEATDKAYQSIKDKQGSFIESDEGSATGKLSDAEKQIVESIKQAGVGKSLI